MSLTARTVGDVSLGLALFFASVYWVSRNADALTFSDRKVAVVSANKATKTRASKVVNVSNEGSIKNVVRDQKGRVLEFSTTISEACHDGDTPYFTNYPQDERFIATSHGLLKGRSHYGDSPEYDERRSEFQQPYGKEAAKHFSKLIMGIETRFVVKGISYGRPIVDMHQGQKNVVIEMTKAGLMWIDPRYIKTKDESVRMALEKNIIVDIGKVKEEDKPYILALNEARKAKRGIWNDPNPESPWCFRVKMKKKAA